MAQQVKNPPAMQETQVHFLGWEDSLEKKMATHSSILAWKIPWTEEPGGLQSHGVAKSQTEQLNKHACLISHKAQGGGVLNVNDIRITGRTCYIDKGWVPLPETLIPEV